MRYFHEGRTLIELIPIVFLLCLLGGMALPALSGWSARHAVLSASHLLHGHLHLARHQALVTGTSTVVCPLSTDVCDGEAGDWGMGWIVFHDPDVHQQCTPDSAYEFCLEHGGRILAMQPALASVSVVANRNVSRRVRFNPQGMSYGYTGRFAFCHPAATERVLGLVVPQTGRIRTALPQELLECDH
ncbi:MAG: hypothetical protein C0462_03700 [Alcanivorax sp.]|nr:hypothetical protein [Alcanivorax sp.]